MNHPLGAAEALKCWLPFETTLKKLPSMLDECGADALITQHNDQILEGIKRIAGKRFPKDLGFASLHTFQKDQISGIDQRNEVLGSYAVDMLIAQINRGEYGLPKEAKLMLHKGLWVDRETTR